MVVWRICQAAYPALDGEGARLFGGRWNSPGTAINYTASTLSLAAIETLVHVDIEDAPDDLVYLRINIPDADYPRIGFHELAHPDDVDWFTTRGDSWAKSKQSVALFVPSMVIPHEYNVLLNHAHADWPQVTVDPPMPFTFDPRLIR